MCKERGDKEKEHRGMPVTSSERDGVDVDGIIRCWKFFSIGAHPSTTATRDIECEIG
jgi:hypothetical protein